MSQACFNYEPVDLPDSCGCQGPQGPQGADGGGTGSQDVYTNATPTPVTVGGVAAGSTFSMETIQQVFDQLFYPYQTPAFTSFSISGQATTIEVGTSLSGSKTFVWTTSNSVNVQATSISIQDVTTSTSLATGLNNTGSQAITLPVTVVHNVPATHTWGITGTNTNSGSLSGSFSVNWRWLEFYGTSTNITLTASQIQALTGSALAASVAGTYALGTGGYKYLCWPSSFTDPTAFKDTSTNLNVGMCDTSDDASYSNVTSGGFNYALVSVTNAQSQTINYKVFRSKNILSSNINIQVT
jgi:hypothetical protein